LILLLLLHIHVIEHLVVLTIVLLQHLVLIHFVYLDIVVQALYMLFVELLRLRLRDLTTVADHTERKVQVLALHAYPIPCSFLEHLLLLLWLLVLLVRIEHLALVIHHLVVLRLAVVVLWNLLLHIHIMRILVRIHLVLLLVVHLAWEGVI